MYKTNLKNMALCLVTCLAALPLSGMVSDGAYFRYALSRVVPGLSEEARIKETVTEFDNRFMDVYASQDKQKAIAQMPAATVMRHRLVKDSGFLWMGGRVLVYDLASLEIKSVHIDGPVTATVVAKEEWNYQYKNDKTWQGIADVHGTGSLYRYKLLRKGGKWLVVKYEPVREVKKGA